MPRRVEYVFLHCTDSLADSVESIRNFHKFVRNPPFVDIGYNWVITNAYPSFEALKSRTPDLDSDGRLWKGRDLDRDGDVEEEIGAHVANWNSKSFGIALVGRDTFSAAQIRQAVSLCRDLCHRYEISMAHVMGHYEADAKKTCPNIDMDWFRSLLRAG